MAKASTICTCTQCDKEFKVEKICWNRKEADNYEVWAAGHLDECPDCYRARVAEENAAKAQVIKEKYHLPEIVGKSGKQTAFANSLRDRYIVNNEKSFEYAKIVWDASHDKAKMDVIIKTTGKTAEEIIAANLEYARCEKAYKLLTESDAGKIIEFLR